MGLANRLARFTAAEILNKRMIYLLLLIFFLKLRSAYKVYRGVQYWRVAGENRILQMIIIINNKR
jgi:hypothetical protein